ncbi:MAG: hypothetical protein J6S69_05595 [Proteobacteria bacterium]|nr:hypothetical protein [Pseudomonadota bacterium]
MKKLLIVLAAVGFCTIGVGCGSIVFGSSNKAPTQPAESETVAPAEEQPVVAEDQTVDADGAKMDCDTYMKGLSDSCFKGMAFEADGVTPLHMRDEAGNDLGEVDQAWTASYCDCYAQTAFQKFGCTEVMADESLDDAAYSAKYAPIVSDCSNVGMPEEAAAADTAVPADAAVTDVATDAAATDAAVPVN